MLPGDTGSVVDSEDLTIKVPRGGLDDTLDNNLGAENEGPCSWGPFSPQFCQVLLSPKVFLVCICWAGAIQVSIIYTFINIFMSFQVSCYLCWSVCCTLLYVTEFYYFLLWLLFIV